MSEGPLVVPIEDHRDPRVADYVRLNDPGLRQLREATAGVEGGFFIAEGVTVIRALLRSPYPLRSLLVTPRRWLALAADVGDLDTTVYVAEPEVVNAVSGFPLHRGALGAADRLPPATVGAVCASAALVVATEGVNDHENLGALFRNAAAFGAGAVLLDPTSCDPLYRRSVRVSMGHVLGMPFTRLPAGADGVRSLQDLGFEVVAMTPSQGADDIDSVGPSAGGRRALFVGAEGRGLSEAVLVAADRWARIPMAAGVDSLNVAAATAVALHRLAPR